MKKYISIILLFAFLYTLPSCVVNRIQVGDYDRAKCKSTVYKKDKELYLFWELVTAKRIDKRLKLQNYEKVMRRNFFDSVVLVGTLGIFSFYTVTIRVQDCDSISISEPLSE